MSDDMREEFLQAFEKAERETEEESGSLLEESSEEEASNPDEGEIVDDAIQSQDQAQSDQPEEPAVQEGSEQEVQNSETQENPTAEANDPALKTDKAPASWSPSNREQWGQLPKGVQEQVAKREREISKTLQDTAVARKAMSQFAKTIEPYRNSMTAAGIQDPISAVGSMLETDHALRHGSSVDKARTIASLMKNYGVDVRELDNVLGAEPVHNSQPDFDQRSYVDQQLAPYKNMVAQQHYAQQNAMHNSANNEVSNFSQDKEFFQDVRNDMANIIEASASSGRNITLDEAYNAACYANPEIRSILDNRQKEKIIMGGNAVASKKMNAAVSVVGHQGGDGAKIKDMNMRDTISHLWDKNMGGDRV